jgi:putative MATE family efflux protein
MTEQTLSTVKGRAAQVRRRSRDQRDYTSGNLHVNIWFLAWPMVVDMLSTSVYRVVDIYWVGKLGSAALAAATLATVIRWVLNSLSMGLGVGGLAVVARRIGEGDEAAANHTAWQVLVMGVLASGIIGGSGYWLAEPILRLLGAEPEVVRLGVPFLRISFAGVGALVMQQICNALLRGAGEARTAMWTMWVGNGGAIALASLIITGNLGLPALGVPGSALAMVLGYALGVVCALGMLLSGRLRLHLRPRDFWLDLPLMWHVVRIAIPSTVQMTLRASSRLVTTSIMAPFGTATLAAYGVAMRILTFALIPGFGFGNAAGTLVGQNLGAEKPDRAAKSAWLVAGYNFVVMVVFVTLFITFARPVIGIFNAEVEVVDIAQEAITFIGLSFLISAIGVVMGRALDGAGATLPAMVINLTTLWGVQIPAAYALANLTTMNTVGIWLGFAISNVANGLLMAGWFLRGSWKKLEV